MPDRQLQILSANLYGTHRRAWLKKESVLNIFNTQRVSIMKIYIILDF